MQCPFDVKCSSVFDKVNVVKAVVFILINKNYNYNFLTIKTLKISQMRFPQSSLERILQR